MITRIELGRIGEDAAVEYLLSCGYKLLERNFRTRYGEVDIVAMDGAELVFVEVKSRSTNRYGTAFESVHKSKQLKIRRLAALYLQSKQGFLGQCRFDVVGVQLDKEGQVNKVTLIRNAF